jgi:PPK2 family polyphosphate:nucleotide phosphotransferase
VRDYRKRFFVEPDEKLRLDEIDTAYCGKHESEEAAQGDIDRFLKQLTGLQQLLYASQEYGILIVLQALDAGGKDGTIRHVMQAFNAQGTTVASFKTPTQLEARHDFLWRVHPHAPAKGDIAVFNRSHYEDVLWPRVHETIDEETCERRYEAIREFERALVQQGTIVLKFFLHISAEEQLRRFGERLSDPARNWKISASDYSERRLWPKYVSAYRDALRATSRKHAPWYVIPSDHKWFRNLAVSQIVAATLQELDMRYPPPAVDLEDIRRKYHAAELGEGPHGG